ncbi:DNA alkylation repair protein [Filimonas effusa]|uniref:DNA alkylation repair protein n=1 Tax=Filimonas effusa TaxID=2508721 RepID=A0A4Q1DBT9_9BACT|nr:DNA alkylation repair protein [Filimonas effusa]RXK86063.1 DNA alkylation repair protein [Filimonas effusa]
MSLLKDLYSKTFYNRLCNSLEKAIPGFNRKIFIKAIYTPAFEDMELKERMRHTTLTLHSFLPADFENAVALLKTSIEQLRADDFPNGGLEFIFFPDYIELYGLNDYKTSVKAMEFITQFITCEFAIRPFLVKYNGKLMQQMLKWSLHSNAAVRRLATEGCRPRLPWATAVPGLKKDPSPILPILENLKTDPSESVRRSVANNLNDISKDHPGLVIGIAAKWKGISKEVDAIIKHGCRTLLKQGHTGILKHYGLESRKLTLSNFVIHTPEVKIGESVSFSFTIANKNSEAQMVRLEYGVYYRKANGKATRKVFKVSERVYAPKEKCTIQRRQKFVLITTRTFYTGQHQLSIIVNGEEKGIEVFELKD